MMQEFLTVVSYRRVLNSRHIYRLPFLNNNENNNVIFISCSTNAVINQGPI